MIHSIMWIERTRDELILQIAQWLIFVIWLFFTSAFGRIVWSIILIPFYTLFGGPIALYAFFKSVYDFGPEHRQRSLYHIISQPVPSKEWDGYFDKPG